MLIKKEDEVGKTTNENLSNAIDKQNDVIASGSKVLGTSNPGIIVMI